MNLFDKSLRLALLAGATLLVACPNSDKEETGEPSDADTDTDADTDSDTDADTDADIETGVAMAFWVANFATSAGEFTSGSFGYGHYGLIAEDWVCLGGGDLPYEGEAPAGCPDCEWSFNLGAIEGYTAKGTYCDQFPAGADGALDTYFDYSWGYSPMYYYDYNGTPLAFEQSIMLYTDEWFAFMYNYNDNGRVSGNAEAISGARPWFDGTSFYNYFYYL